MDKADLTGGVCIALLGILLIFIIIPYGTEPGVYFGLPPTFFPTLLAWGMTACAVALAIQAAARVRTRDSPNPLPIGAWNVLMFVASAALAIAGVMAIERFGLYWGGPALIGAFMLFLGERNVVRIALTSTLPVALVYMLATYVLHTPLP